MTHLEIENLASEYVEGQLDASSLKQVETHLADCAACRQMMGDLQATVSACRAAENLPVPGWLVQKIILATVGKRKPNWRERAAAYFRPVLQQRFAYAVAMVVFSLSIIVNAAGLNLRNLTLSDLNPRTWIRQAGNAGVRFYSRVEKYYEDLRVVYEIQSRFHQPESQGQQQETQPAKPAGHQGGTTINQPPEAMKLALVEAPVSTRIGNAEPGRRPLP